MDAEWTTGRHMAENSTHPTWDAAALATQLGKIAEQSQRLVQNLLLDRPDCRAVEDHETGTNSGIFGARL